MVRPRNVNRTKIEKQNPDWEQETFNSRSEIKRAAQAITDLGVELSTMSAENIAAMDLPDALHKAILQLKKMKNGPALKRQKQYIGKLLREDEAQIIKIKAHLAEIERQKLRQNAHFHYLEKWRDKLLKEGNTAVTEIMQLYPQIDSQQLRQWIRNAHKEQKDNKPPKAARELFNYLKHLEW